MTALETALAVFAAGLVRVAYKGLIGRDMFPANPKGPLYRWFGKATHDPVQLRPLMLRAPSEEPPYEEPCRRLEPPFRPVRRGE